jgi:hypothetical protein
VECGGGRWGESERKQGGKSKPIIGHCSRGRGTSLVVWPPCNRGRPFISPEWKMSSNVQGWSGGPEVTVWVSVPRKKKSMLEV